MSTRTHVVLLRGVNVGKAKRVPMAAFKEMLLGIGCDVPVVVKTACDLRAIVSENSLVSRSTNPSRMLVVFAQTGSALSSLTSVAKVTRKPDQFLLGGKAAYLHCLKGILASEAALALLGKTGHAITTRNWATVLKLNVLCSEPETGGN